MITFSILLSHLNVVFPFSHSNLSRTRNSTLAPVPCHSEVFFFVLFLSSQILTYKPQIDVLAWLLLLPSLIHIIHDNRCLSHSILLAFPPNLTAVRITRKPVKLGLLLQVWIALPVTFKSNMTTEGKINC